MGAPVTYHEWADALLFAIASGTTGARADEFDPSERWQWLIAWAQLEDTRAAYNPLASTLPLAGSTRFNQAGVRNYPDISSGLLGVLNVLLGRDAAARGYAAIVTALLGKGSTFVAFQNALSRSAWSGLPRDGKHYLVPNYDPAWADRVLPGAGA